MKILIVDDEKLLRWSLVKTVGKAGHETIEAGMAREAREIVVAEEPDIVLLDINLPDGNGIEILEWIKTAYPEMMVLMITARGRVDDAVTAMRLGAYDYIEKPIDMADLTERLSRVCEVIELKREVWRLGRGVDKERKVHAASPAMVEILRLAHTVAESEAQTILLTGESGTGKDILAHYIHDHSPRRHRPFMAINFAAVPETLMESELFGHERGAFTDAKQQKKGILELSDDGTVFFDEIGEMTPAIQVKLLRVLEERAFRRVGGSREISVNVRVIAATNRDLKEMVADHLFREDLYYRLNVFPIEIPPLRERPEDIRLLAEQFLKDLNLLFHKTVVKFSDEAMARLLAHPWPGNVRELRNIIERMMILQQGEVVGVEDIPLEGRESACTIKGVVPLDEAERRLIVRALEVTKGNVTRAAGLLGITRDRLRYKIKKHDLKT